MLEVDLSKFSDILTILSCFKRLVSLLITYSNTLDVLLWGIPFTLQYSASFTKPTSAFSLFNSYSYGRVISIVCWYFVFLLFIYLWSEWLSTMMYSALKKRYLRRRIWMIIETKILIRTVYRDLSLLKTLKISNWLLCLTRSSFFALVWINGFPT